MQVSLGGDRIETLLARKGKNGNLGRERKNAEILQ
jgi:hypothetical protein